MVAEHRNGIAYFLNLNYNSSKTTTLPTETYVLLKTLKYAVMGYVHYVGPSPLLPYLLHILHYHD